MFLCIDSHASMATAPRWQQKWRAQPLLFLPHGASTRNRAHTFEDSGAGGNIEKPSVLTWFGPLRKSAPKPLPELCLFLLWTSRPLSELEEDHRCLYFVSRIPDHVALVLYPRCLSRANGRGSAPWWRKQQARLPTFSHEVSLNWRSISGFRQPWPPFQ